VEPGHGLQSVFIVTVARERSQPGNPSMEEMASWNWHVKIECETIKSTAHTRVHDMARLLGIRIKTIVLWRTSN
jgi:hypothetical protein